MRHTPGLSQRLWASSSATTPLASTPMRSSNSPTVGGTPEACPAGAPNANGAGDGRAADGMMLTVGSPHYSLVTCRRRGGMPEVRGVFGRGRELGVVAAFLDGLRSGPSGLLLAGEAGIGKTTGWSAGVADAAERTYLVLSSRPAEAEAKLSFAALGDLLAGVIEQVLPGLPPPQQNALRVALLLEDPVGSPPEPRAVCAAFLGAIRSLAAQGPVIIAVDDLQWLDGPSAVTLDYALRRLTDEPVGLLASVRVAVGGPDTPPAGAGLPAGRLRRLRIGPLAPADFEAAIWASAGDRLSRLTTRRLFDASGGNLFYGLELARALGRLETEPLPGEPLPVPAGLFGVLS